jgi:hypothetical protein
MVKFLKATLLASVSLFVLSGCAGLVAPFINNPYAGTYDGTFLTSTGLTGPASVSLTNIGHVFGTLTNTATNTTGQLTGTVDTHLVFNGTVAFGTTSENVSGTFTSNAGQITGTLNGPNGYTFALDVNQQKVSGSSRKQ